MQLPKYKPWFLFCSSCSTFHYSSHAHYLWNLISSGRQKRKQAIAFLIKHSMFNFCVFRIENFSLRVHHSNVSSATILLCIRWIYDITEILLTANGTHFLFTLIFPLFERIRVSTQSIWENAQNINSVYWSLLHTSQFQKRAIFLLNSWIWLILRWKKWEF